MKLSWDVIVVGAGAAGLYAAATAAFRGRSTLLIEKNKKLGVKILMSGGTRCNITHDTSWRGIADAFGAEQGRFLKFSLATLPPEHVIREFNESGLPTKIESTGKIFPQSDRAIDVRDALVSRARAAGVEILNECPVTEVLRSPAGFQVSAMGKRYRSHSLVLTTGGQSYPGCGTTGAGYGWLKQFGHSIKTPRPALAPIRISEQWVRDLAGITIPDTSLTTKLHDAPKRKGNRERDVCRGSFLFTHKGCSGPAVLNISRNITDPQLNYRKSLVCNWLPEFHEQSLRHRLESAVLQGQRKQVGNFFCQRLPRRLVIELFRQAAVPFDQSLSEVSRKQMSGLIQKICCCEMNVSGTLGFEKAEVTAGGAALDQVDRNTMKSNLVPGLFLAGEILDIDGPIGGYNFQAAFSTGFVAGSNA